MATFQVRFGEILERVGFALRVLLSATLLAQIMLAPAANAHAFVGEVPSGNFPQTTAAVISAIEAAGEAANVVITYTDDLTGNRVSKTWSELDPDTRDFLKGATFFIPPGAGLKIGRALPGSKVLTAPNRTQLIDDLVAGGTRITPENVVDIRSVNGRTVWLETGNSRAGLQHITDGHAQDFANRGVTQGKIPDLIFNALERGQVVGTAGTGRNLRSIYEVDFNGVTQRIGIGVSDNGFIVTAHPG